MTDLTTAKTQALIDEIQARLKRLSGAESLRIEKGSSTFKFDGPNAKSISDLDPRPEPQTLTERAAFLSRARMPCESSGWKLAGDRAELIADLASAVDELKAQVAELSKNSYFNVTKHDLHSEGCDLPGSKSGPDLLEAAKGTLESFVGHGQGFEPLARLRDAIAAEEARRKVNASS